MQQLAVDASRSVWRGRRGQGTAARSRSAGRHHVEELMPASLENLVIGVATSAVTAVIVWAWGRLARLRRRNRRAAFFGLSPGDPCVVVMNRHNEASNAMHHNDVEGLVDLIRLVEEIGAKPVVVRFDRILEPAGETAELCIGGPASNERARVHLKTYLPGIQFRPYAAGEQRSLAIVTGDDVFPYEETELEHVVLARFYPDASSYPVILISGQSSLSNRGAISYLAKHYERSVRLLHPDGESFCFVLTLKSPLVYGIKSVHLAKDVTATAFRPPQPAPQPPSAAPAAAPSG
jgi:hypothetical protein